MPGLSLEVVEGPDAGLQVPLDRPVVVGRQEGVDVQLRDRQVSRQHARLTPANGDVVIEDLGSSNGTFVNHAQLHVPARVEPGDELVIGVSVLQLRTAEQIRSQPSAVRPVPPALAAPERPPTYVGPAPQRPATPAGPPELTGLLDVRTRAQAKLAPLAILVLVAFVLIIYFATR